MVKPAIVLLGASALPLAQQLKALLQGEIHGPALVEPCDVTYAKATSHIADLFQQRRPIIGLCAAAILIRALAPVLNDKQTEPPVLAMAEDGSSIVPLLGGHHGANDLARRIAAALHSHAAITTAGDVRFHLALDQPLPGYTLANPQHVKGATQALLNGAALALLAEGDRHLPIAKPDLEMTTWHPDFTGVTIEVTTKAKNGGPQHLVYHPHTLAIGLGCERGTSPQEVAELVNHTLASQQLSPLAIAAYGSVDVKSDEPAINHWPNVRFFNAEQLAAQEPRLATPSAYVKDTVGTPGVAEAAALALAGQQAQLIIPKAKSARATIAIAQSPGPILALAGQPRGQLFIVGLGPGTPDYRSPAATHALAHSTDWVGYGLYLDLASDITTERQEHRFPLGGEEERCRHAIALARAGKTVSLICSGDAGIYAMAALVYELLDLQPERIAVEVIPGISAFQLASARAGALIGHDFCCISLSDLLTPWPVIENRLQAAAQGDFVIAFYNPRSLRRRDQLERAFAILKSHRPSDTPVVIASNLGRREEKVTIVPFHSFDPDMVDMLTLVMVGSSQSTSLTRGDGRIHAYTPRGYAKKRETS